MPSGTPAAEYSLVNFGADTENVLNNWIEPVAQSLMDGVNGIIITVFTVWLLWQGYRFLWGEYKSSKEFMWRIHCHFGGDDGFVFPIHHRRRSASGFLADRLAPEHQRGGKQIRLAVHFRPVDSRLGRH